jgi:hypothetical protein
LEGVRGSVLAGAGNFMVGQGSGISARMKVRRSPSRSSGGRPWLRACAGGWSYLMVVAPLPGRSTGPPGVAVLGSNACGRR